MRTSFFVCVLAGCGSVAPARGPAGPDAATDAKATDSSTVRCNPTAPFGAPVLVSGINSTASTVSEAGASLTPDQLTIYFASNRLNPGSANFDIYFATRPSTVDAFDAGTKVDALDLGGDERSTWVLPDTLMIYFYSSGIGSNYDLYVSTRTNTSSAFGTPQPLGINTTAIEEGGSVTGDGKTLYFERAGSDDEVYRSVNAGDGFTSATAVGELNSPDAFSPIPSPDDLTIYFASGRAGGAGNADIYSGTRSSTSSSFNNITNLAELNSTAYDTPTWISPDGCDIYFTSSRSGYFHVWSASRPH